MFKSYNEFIGMLKEGGREGGLHIFENKNLNIKLKFTGIWVI